MHDDVAREADLLIHGAAVRRRDDLVVVNVRGEDARTWLNGQVSNDTRAIAPGTSVYALVLSAKGRILADVRVVDRAEGGLAMLLPRSTLATVLEHLEHYIIMEDVELAVDDATSVISIDGARADEVSTGDLERHASRELGVPGALVLVGASEVASRLAAIALAAERVGGGLVSDAAFEVARLRLGAPRFGPDFGEATYPQEAGLEARAVSFQKGCYLGQEVVCMLENRGQLNRRLVRSAREVALAPGAALAGGGGAPAGSVTSATRDGARWLGLGFVKRAMLERAAPVVAHGSPVELLGPVA